MILYIFLLILYTTKTQACLAHLPPGPSSSACGGNFYRSSGRFQSPYTSTNSCRWYIFSLYSNERIILNITHLNIPKTPDCSLGYVEVRDGEWSNSSILGKFCGTGPINPIISSGNTMQIFQHNHDRYSNQNFVATYESICGGTILLENETRLKFPELEGNYKPDEKCIWYIKAQKNHQIMVQFENFDLENCCLCDYVEILDGSVFNNSLLGRFCGSRIPPAITSSSNSLVLKFVSDSTDQRSGFLANIIAHYNECGGTLRGPSGRINRTTVIVRHNVTCNWKIVTTPGSLLVFNFTVFNTTRTCDKKLEIFYRTFENSTESLGTFCGQTNSVESITNEVEIRYTSDEEVPGSKFILDYSTKIDCSIQSNCHHNCVNNPNDGIQCLCEDGYTLQENNLDCKKDPCEYEISSPSGYIQTPNYPQNYSNNLDCTWRFKTKPGHRINITFLEFRLENSPTCFYDNVRLNEKSPSINEIITSSTFCGIYNETIVKTSTTEEIEMFFKSDKSNVDKGFNASYSSICGGNFSATASQKYIFSHLGFGVSKYENNVDCEWEIKPVSGYNFVRIAIDILGMETSKNCSSDFVEVFGGILSLGKFCDMKELPAKFRSENFLIRFHTNHINDEKGFQIKYKAVN